MSSCVLPAPEKVPGSPATEAVWNGVTGLEDNHSLWEWEATTIARIGASIATSTAGWQTRIGTFPSDSIFRSAANSTPGEPSVGLGPVSVAAWCSMVPSAILRQSYGD